MRVRFLEPARHELDETISYYNTELASLGEAFLLEVLSAIERIRHHPKAWHPLSENTRRCRLKRFPYGLIYEADDAEVLIIAVANLHRRPDYWRKRRSG
jgi:plasmid stabilization system protein ParE